jgi:hypothetical protein
MVKPLMMHCRASHTVPMLCIAENPSRKLHPLMGKTAHRGLPGLCNNASAAPRSQVLNASGKNSRRATTARQSPLLPQTTKPPCNTAGNAPSPQQYQNQGQQSAQMQAYLNSTDDGSGAAATAGLLLGLSNLFSFHRGGALDAQAYGSSPAYANYAYGDYLSAAGFSLPVALSGANLYAFLGSTYPAATVMSPTYPSTPSSNVSNITGGFNAQQNGTLCTTTTTQH